MQLILKPHPNSPRGPATQVGVTVTRSAANVLELSYVVRGAIADMGVPTKAASARTDELWRHTCLEAFLRPPTGDGYFEFNFSPSTRWAAYRFDSYRAGMAPLTLDAPPLLAVDAGADTLTLRALLTLDALAASDDAPWRLGLTAVIESGDGAHSYWSLAHAPGKPDFHHGDTFAAHVPAARAP